MKTIKTILVFILVIIALIFAFQNFEDVRISFYKWNVEMPLAFAIIGIYFLGALTGGVLYSVLKKITRLDKKSE